MWIDRISNSLALSFLEFPFIQWVLISPGSSLKVFYIRKTAFSTSDPLSYVLYLAASFNNWENGTQPIQLSFSKHGLSYQFPFVLIT